jgi:hypothetical protein
MCFTHQNTVVFLLNLLDVIAQKHNKIISLLFMLMELDCLLTVATSGLIIHPPHDMSMKSNAGMTMTGKPKNLEKNLSQCHFVHRKSYMD